MDDLHQASYLWPSVNLHVKDNFVAWHSVTVFIAMQLVIVEIIQDNYATLQNTK